MNTSFSSLILTLLISFVSISCDHHTPSSQSNSTLHALIDYFPSPGDEERIIVSYLHVITSSDNTRTLSMCTSELKHPRRHSSQEQEQERKDDVGVVQEEEEEESGGLQPRQCTPVFYDQDDNVITMDKIRLKDVSSEEWRDYIHFSVQHLQDPKQNTPMKRILSDLAMMLRGGVVYITTYKSLEKLIPAYPAIQKLYKYRVLVTLAVTAVINGAMQIAILRRNAHNFPFAERMNSWSLKPSEKRFAQSDFVLDYAQKATNTDSHFIPGSMDLPGIAQKIAIFLNTTERVSSPIVKYCFPSELTHDFKLGDDYRERIQQHPSIQCAKVYTSYERTRSKVKEPSNGAASSFVLPD